MSNTSFNLKDNKYLEQENFHLNYQKPKPNDRRSPYYKWSIYQKIKQKQLQFPKNKFN